MKKDADSPQSGWSLFIKNYFISIEQWLLPKHSDQIVLLNLSTSKLLEQSSKFSYFLSYFNDF